MLLLSASLVDFRPMHSSEALHAHSDRQVLGNALGFADFQRVTFHLNEKSANQGLHMDKSQLVVQVMFRSFLKTGRSQPVDATLAWSLLAGVSKPKVFRGR